MTGGSAETHLIVVCFFILTLKIWLDKYSVFPGPPDDIIKKTSVPHVVITVGKRSIVVEWLPEDNGRRERVWWMAPMVSVL